MGVSKTYFKELQKRSPKRFEKKRFEIRFLIQPIGFTLRPY